MNLLDPVRNLIKKTVASTYNSAATSINLSDASGLPDPATEGAFNLTWFDSTNYSEAADDPNAEIIRVTAISGNTLTILRGQESSVATDKNTAGAVYIVINAITKKTIDDIDETFLGWNKYTKVIPTRASADDPTYVLTFAGVDLTSKVSLGMKIKWTQNSTVRYGFVTAISFSTDTTLTLYGGTNYDVEDTSTYAISDVYFSHQETPFNFPSTFLNEEFWHEVGDTGEPAFQNGWVNYGSQYTTVAFKVVNNILFMKGLIKNGSDNSVAFTLPYGNIPAKEVILGQWNNTTTMTRVDIQTNGDVYIFTGGSVALSLDGINIPLG